MDHARKIALIKFSCTGSIMRLMDQIDHYAETLLSNEKEGRRIFEKVEDDMVIETYAKNSVSLTVKKVTFEEYEKLTN